MAIPVLGMVFRPEFETTDLRRVVEVADDAGLEHLWLWEDCFLQGGFSMATAALAWTQNLNVHVGVFPAPLRNCAIMAMEISTVAQMFPGRFHPGVGHGVQSWMKQIGAAVASPLTLLEEYVTTLRALLAGEEVTVDGRYVSLDAVQLDWPPAQVPELTLAATGPKTLELAGRVGDTTLLTGDTMPDGVRAARVNIERGRIAAGRTDPATVAVYVPVELEAGADEAARKVMEFAEAGADVVILQPGRDEKELDNFVRFVAQEVPQRLQR